MCAGILVICLSMAPIKKGLHETLFSYQPWSANGVEAKCETKCWRDSASVRRHYMAKPIRLQLKYSGFNFLTNAEVFCLS